MSDAAVEEAYNALEPALFEVTARLAGSEQLTARQKFTVATMIAARAFATAGAAYEVAFGTHPDATRKKTAETVMKAISDLIEEKPEGANIN
ncbi:MAG: hypothetical protein AAF720_01000 [Pseudomonadota bacterium]